MTDLPYSLDSDGSARLAVRLTARAGRDRVAGLVDAGGGRFALSVKVAAPPVDGAANRALIAFLARKLDVPKSSIRLVSGETSRLKILRIVGAAEPALRTLI
ncbi:MAG TPA: DUF167 domain-containing protein [Allosphingosinicella sp.]